MVRIHEQQELVQGDLVVVVAVDFLVDALPLLGAEGDAHELHKEPKLPAAERVAAVGVDLIVQALDLLEGVLRGAVQSLQHAVSDLAAELPGRLGLLDHFQHRVRVHLAHCPEQRGGLHDVEEEAQDHDGGQHRQELPHARADTRGHHGEPQRGVEGQHHEEDLYGLEVQLRLAAPEHVHRLLSMLESCAVLIDASC